MFICDFLLLAIKKLHPNILRYHEVSTTGVTPLAPPPPATGFPVKARTPTLDHRHVVW